ncbi:MAG: hypothetical protein IKO36_03675 [Bacteroidaceae bacterium]|nr:hypothetical protein [Bacteroidaceae bacterium]
MVQKFKESCNNCNCLYDKRHHGITYKIKAVPEWANEFVAADVLREDQSKKRLLNGNEISFYYDDNQIWVYIPRPWKDTDRIARDIYGFHVNGNLRDYHKSVLSTKELSLIENPNCVIQMDDETTIAKVAEFACNFFNKSSEPVFD